MHVFAIGVDHHRASLSFRERVAFTRDQLPEALTKLKQMLGVGLAHPQSVECVILSTCNRTELYVASPVTNVTQVATQFLAHYAQLSSAEVESYLYSYQNHLAAQHLFQVASGMESMVLGETQISGQIKEALFDAEKMGTVSTHLQQLFQRSFRAAKEVRSSTLIGSQVVSMPSMVARLSNKIFGDMQEVSLLFVGAGEMIEHCANYLVPLKPKTIYVANRSRNNAQLLVENWAPSLQVTLVSLEAIAQVLPMVDLVVSSTAADATLISYAMVEAALKRRQFKPMMFVDLAVPRDVDEQVRRLNDVYLYTVDDLGSLIQGNLESRTKALAGAREIVMRHGAEWLTWFESRQSGNYTRELMEKIEQVRLSELEKAQKNLNKEDMARCLDVLSKNLTNKLIHGLVAELGRADAHEREALKALYEKFFRHL